MLSLILSWLFRVAFILSLAIALINVIVEVKQSPIYYDKRENGYSSLGAPGITVTANRSNIHEKRAPDTTIRYRFPNSNNPQGWGELTLNTKGSDQGKKLLDKLIADQKRTGDSLILDSQVTVIRQQEWGDQLNNPVGTVTSKSMEELADGRVVMEKAVVNDNKLLQKSTHDTFPDMMAANMFSETGTTNKGPLLTEEITEETLRLKPENIKQRVFFVLYVAIRAICGVLLLLMLSRLFRNFYKKDYFTAGNVRILRNIGWLLLIPELLKTVLYWGLLFKIHPAKIFASSASREVKMVCQYEILSGIEFHLVFLGLGILVLTYIFKKGLNLKEQQEFTI